jgi:hypothetical protein
VDRATFTERRFPWAFAAALILLSLLFHLPSLFGGVGGIGRIFTPSFDAAVLALALCLYTWIALPGVTVFAGLLAIVGLTVMSFQTVDAVIPLFFNRPFELFTDITYIPDLYALLRDTLPGWLFYPGLFVLAAALAGVGLGLYIDFRILHRGFQDGINRYGFLLLIALLVTIDLLSPFRFVENTAAPRMAEEMIKVVHKDVYVQEQQEMFSKQVQQFNQVKQPLEELDGQDVYLFILESYGYTLYSEPVHFGMIQPELRDFEDQLGQAGFRIASTFLNSTAFGGNSWLADSTLSTGVRIDNEAAYELLLESDVKPIAQFFNQIGYRTVMAMPATTYAWPEGEYYSFAEKYYFKDFAYKGPNLKWAPMTDQYVLDFIYRKEVQGARQPLFIQYVMISSHYPFNMIPRFFEDWSDIGDGSIYHRDDSVTILPIKPGNQTAGPEGYVTIMAYELTIIREYLKTLVAGDALIIIVGDHQPYSGITGKNKPWSVPLHLISRRAEFLEPFLARGYSKGFIPRQELPHRGLETFLPNFLESFSSGELSAADRSASIRQNDSSTDQTAEGLKTTN